MYCSEPLLQAIAPPSFCTLQQVEKWNLNQTKRDGSWKENKYFDKEESENKVMGQLHKQKLTFLLGLGNKLILNQNLN